MPELHGPSFDCLNLSVDLPPDHGPSLGLCPLFLREPPVGGVQRREPRSALLGPRTCASTPVEPAAPYWELGWSLAKRASSSSCLAPLTLPVWAVKPWFGVGFHSAHISSVYGVLLYPILDGFARHAWLGPRTAARAKPSNANRATATRQAGRRCVLYCLWPVALGSWSTGLIGMVQ